MQKSSLIDRWAEDANGFSVIEKIANGGKGSGNFGHSGRPGEVGGSGKGEIRKAKQPTREEYVEAANWTEEEIDDVQPYFGTKDYSAIQDYMRGKGDTQLTLKKTLGSDPPMASEVANKLLEKVKNSKLPGDDTLYRGMLIQNGRVESVIKKGFTSKVFQSATQTENHAYYMSDPSERGKDPEKYTQVILKINAKKGSIGVAAPRFDEEEVVLPPNIKFKNIKVISRDNGDKRGYPRIELEVDYE